ncbi:hypothetical protein [Absidia glauca]|uniref:Uncharacterized protein n=1 Tax=Absidia glauca TaxID=4829 RepID=A0A168RSU9_ABSGL|nr:hypothetical protein [Absidia glauca]
MTEEFSPPRHSAQPLIPTDQITSPFNPYGTSRSARRLLHCNTPRAQRYSQKLVEAAKKTTLARFPLDTSSSPTRQLPQTEAPTDASLEHPQDMDKDMDHSQVSSRQQSGTVTPPTNATASSPFLLSGHHMEARAPANRPRKRQLHQQSANSLTTASSLTKRQKLLLHNTTLGQPAQPTSSLSKQQLPRQSARLANQRIRSRSRLLTKGDCKPHAVVLGLSKGVVGKEGDNGQRRIRPIRRRSSCTAEERLDRLLSPHDTLDLSQHSMIPNRSGNSTTKQPAVVVLDDDSDDGNDIEMSSPTATGNITSNDKSHKEGLPGDGDATLKVIVQHDGSRESGLVYGHSIQMEPVSCLVDASLSGPSATTRYQPHPLVPDEPGALESLSLAMRPSPSSVHPTLDGDLTTVPPHAFLPTSTHLVSLSPHSETINRNDDRHPPTTTSSKCDTSDPKMETPRAICPTAHDSCPNQPTLKHVADDAQQPEDTKADCCMTVDNLEQCTRTRSSSRSLSPE